MKHPEMHIHNSIVDWLRLKLPKALVHHSPNEFGMSGREVARQVAKHKRMGMFVGFPDLVVLDKGRLVGLEVKAGKNRQSAAQKDAEKAFQENLAEYHVVRSIDDVARIFEGQL